MASSKRVFTLRLSDEVFEKIGQLATREHRSMTNYIEYVLLQHLPCRGKKRSRTLSFRKAPHPLTFLALWAALPLFWGRAAFLCPAGRLALLLF